MADDYSKNDRALEVMGQRMPDGEFVIPFDQPVELGFWCPVCRVESTDEFLDERLKWSEYESFIWCSVCNYDYPTALCVRLDGDVIPERVDGEINHPSTKWGGRDYAVRVFLDSVAQAIQRKADG